MPALGSCSLGVESLESSTQAEILPESIPPWGLQGLQTPNASGQAAHLHRGLPGAGCPTSPAACWERPLPAPLLQVSGSGGVWEMLV